MSTTLNNFKVKPVKGGGGFDKQKVRGSELFEDPYCNIAIIGPKAKGKSTLVYNIVEEVCYKNNVIIFSPTVFNDSTYKSMIKMLTEKRKANTIVYDHFIDSTTGVNRINELIKLLQQKEETKVVVKKICAEPKIPVCNFGDPIKEEKPKEDKPEKPTKIKPLTAEYVIIYDDLSTDMRDKSIYQMLVKNRHFKCKNILCLHNSINILPGSWGNIDYILFLGDIPEDKFLKIQEDAAVQYPDDTKHYSTLYNAYKMATKEPYNFLYLNRNTKELRKNFNKLITI